MAHLLSVALLLLLCAAHSLTVLGTSRVGPVDTEKRVVEKKIEKVDDDVEDIIESLENLYKKEKKSKMSTSYGSVSKKAGKLETRQSTGLSSEDTVNIVNFHNQLRASEGASNMQILRYNADIAALAQTWTDGCIYEHGNPPFSAANGGFSGLGQNMYYTTGTFNPVTGIQLWYNEKSDFTLSTRDCNPGAQCGHYTQVVWAATTDVGCGVTFCPTLYKNGAPKATDANFFVCNYGPQGNVYSSSEMYPPYSIGSPCTQCSNGVFFCNSDLCDNTCSTSGPTCQCNAACQNGAATNTAGCTCTCSAGYTGTDCSAVCQNFNPSCGDNNGWPQFMCSSTDPAWIPQMVQCPLLCGKCVAPQRRSNEKLQRLVKLLGYIEKEIEKIE
jgi:hypothetical protein